MFVARAASVMFGLLFFARSSSRTSFNYTVYSLRKKSNGSSSSSHSGSMLPFLLESIVFELMNFGGGALRGAGGGARRVGGGLKIGAGRLSVAVTLCLNFTGVVLSAEVGGFTLFSCRGESKLPASFSRGVDCEMFCNISASCMEDVCATMPEGKGLAAAGISSKGTHETEWRGSAKVSLGPALRCVKKSASNS